MRKFNFENPENWTFETAVYHYVGSEETVEFADALMREMAEYNGVDGRTIDFLDYDMARKTVLEAGIEDSRYMERGTCDHCGAHFHYGALYRNHEGEVAVVGNICASTKLNLTAHEYADAKMRAQIKRIKQKAKADRRENALAANRREALNYDHYIVSDIRAKFRKWGNCSVKQWALVKKIAREGAEREARFAEEKKTLVAIPADVLEARTTIHGDVLSLKWKESRFGGAYKMLVKDERGFKVWGTCPDSIIDIVSDIRNKDQVARVTFDAKVTVSDDDETFGFYSRPTKAAASVAA